MAKCSHCRYEASPRMMPVHLEVCEQRPLPCPYCEMKVQACNLEIHMEDCDQRPASCIYCDAEFDTFIALRDNHMEVCPENPDNRPCRQLGRKDQVPSTNPVHPLYSDSHVNNSMDHIMKLEATVQTLSIENEALKQRVRNLEDNQESIRKLEETRLASHSSEAMDEMYLKLEAEIQVLRKSNATLMQRAAGLEDCQEMKKEIVTLQKQVRALEDSQKTDEYVRANLVDTLEELRGQMSVSEAAATLHKQDMLEDVNAAIQELKNKTAAFEEILRGFLDDQNEK